MPARKSTADDDDDEATAAPDSDGAAGLEAEAEVVPRRPRRKRRARSAEAEAGAAAAPVAGTMAVSAWEQRRARDEEQKPRVLLLAGAVGACVGLAMVGSGPSVVGPWVCLASLLVLIYGVHSSGRLGPS